MNKKRSPDSSDWYQQRPGILRRTWWAIRYALSRLAPGRLLHDLGWYLGFVFYYLVRVPLGMVGHLAVVIGGRFVAAWRAGTLRQLAAGLPFLLVAGVSGYLAAACSLQKNVEIADRYQLAARRAASADNFEAANIYFERLVQLEGPRQDTLFRWAQAAQNAGDGARVDALLAILAPLDKGTHAESHLWQAQRLLGTGDVSRDRIHAAHTHLLHAVRLHPASSQIRGTLGELYMSMGEWDRAAEQLSAAVAERPELSLKLAKAHSLQGNAEQAAAYGERARTYFQGRSASDPKNLAVRLGWAESCMFLERFPEAVGIIREGLLFADEPLLRTALARVYVVWADSLPQTDQGRREKLALLQEGLRSNPNEMILFDRMMSVLVQDDESSEQARAFLVSNIARGQALGISHLLLGTYEGEKGNLDAAVRHLEQAYKLDASTPIAANNLAWYLMQRKPPELEKALTLIDSLVKKWPNTAALRDTRGQILARMGRWNEALADLEAALPQMPDNQRLHTALAVVYEKLNMKDLAAAHRELAAKLKAAKSGS